MGALDDRRRLEELYLPPADEFVLVDVPDLQFVMIDGEGDPNGEAFSRAVRWLFSAIYPVKRIAKERMGTRFVEPPLEGLWWADDMNDFVAGNLHHEFLPEHDLAPNGYHHEIYLTDPNRVAPAGS